MGLNVAGDADPGDGATPENKTGWWLNPAAQAAPRDEVAGRTTRTEAAFLLTIEKAETLLEAQTATAAGAAVLPSTRLSIVFHIETIG